MELNNVDIEALTTFVTVVREGSFIGAARTLRLPRSTVSQRVVRLEAALHVRLLERTSRVVRTTTAGAAYFQRCEQILEDLAEANAALQDFESEPRGLLRVATRPLIGTLFLAEFTAAFVRQYPLVEVELLNIERPVRLVDEGIDVAVVLSDAMFDASLIRRHLGAGERWCCASPAYLESRRGRPQTPSELAVHDCIVDTGSRTGSWCFEQGEARLTVNVRGRLCVSSVSLAHRAALGGAGVANIPRVLCEADVQQGRLVRLLDPWRTEPSDLLVVYPSKRFLSPRVRNFVEALVARYPAEHGRDETTWGSSPSTS